MRYLFVHQNFPGQYLHLLREIAGVPGNEIVFISEPNANAIEGVRRILYTPPKPDQESVHYVARDFDFAARRAEIVAGMAMNLKRLGFSPDIILGHHGWGELLNLPDVWPDVPLLGYFEFYYHTNGQDVDFDSEFPIASDRFPRIRAMNVVNHLALALNQHGQTPTRWQLTRYPSWAQQRIRLIREGARLDVCRPDPEACRQDFAIGEFRVTQGEKLVTYVARNLEPYRGFHIMMRALPHLLSARPDVKVVMVGGDDVSYGARLAEGTWREHFQKQLAGKYDASRVLLPGQIPYDTYLKMLQRSDAHVYLTYPFVASWSLREALAMGCAIVAADVEPVSEFITHDRNGLLIPALDPKNLAATVQHVLEDNKLNQRLRTGARRYAERHLDMHACLGGLTAMIRELTGA
ncbi:MAG: glycosyltransferase [Alphaproteobacteria bacterium]|nr:glycosyltransferase [Alphaproteobacteria bacterium]